MIHLWLIDTNGSMCRKLLVRDEQEMFALASEENHVDELHHALKGLLGQERDYTSTVFAGEITFSHLRAAPSLSCCRQVLPSLPSAGGNSVIFHSKWVILAEDVPFKILQPNPDFLPLMPADGEGYQLSQWSSHLSGGVMSGSFFSLISGKIWLIVPCFSWAKIGNSYWVAGISFLDLTGNRKLMKSGSFITEVLQLWKWDSSLLK